MASLFCVFSVDHQRLPFLWQGLFPEWEFGAVYVFVLLQSICRCFVYSHSWLTWRFLSFISYPFRILLCWPLFFACKCRFFYCPGPISMYSFTDVVFFFPSEFYLFVCFPNVFGLFTSRRFWAGLLEMVFFGHENIQLERLGSFSLPILNWGKKCQSWSHKNSVWSILEEGLKMLWLCSAHTIEKCRGLSVLSFTEICMRSLPHLYVQFYIPLNRS